MDRRRKSRRTKRRKRRGCLHRLFALVLMAAVLITGYNFIFARAEYEESELIEKGYPESLAKLYVRNEEARRFVLDYNDKKDAAENIDISGEVKKGKIPLFLQWDERWGYGKYGDEFMAVAGCGPTSLSMVYCGLTGDDTMNPWEVAKLADEMGYYVSGAGSSWSMMEDVAEMLGLTVESVYFEKNSILNRLEEGCPIICIVGPGDFTTEGHFIVLTETDGSGMVTVRDPNSKKKSRMKWDIETVMNQTLNLWSYDY